MPRPGSDGELRVALLSPCYWPEVRRGSERIVRELADGLIAQGHRPTLITSHRGRPSRAIEDGLRVIRVPRPPQAPLLRAHCEQYTTHVPLSYLALRAGSYDLAHAVYPTDALAAIRWGHRTAHPVVMTYMGIPAASWLAAARGRRPITERAVTGSDAVVVLSRSAAQALRDSTGNHAEVIHPGVDLATFVPRTEPRPEPAILCTAGPDVARKNVGLLVDAFKLLRETRPEARLVLVRPTDARAAAANGIHERTPGIDWISQDHRPAVLAGEYSRAWLTVLPAVDEAFGMTLIESLACGTPVVGYRGGGIPEIIDREGIGLLFDRLEPAELARALERGLELRDAPSTSARCRSRAEEFSTAAATEHYLALYRRLLETRR